ncbi:MAG: peptidoglycan bridge formation glycyltransferase FemA/FemB family protein [Chloroflexi bacterium]|nr:peptidoglycan bridge formation glycyltransferase FemA/FemB family protein [Chloroflexota bacterium]MBU1750183.1 peptidoglycan bridge formation glycyltransferase FemA/FemB family protein [Chloroflexota bacterium]MBU1878426.1 peptidoglycan bridge formation glycyltransferase FemA/FemB family protein [Chloroflexota bacterium]
MITPPEIHEIQSAARWNEIVAALPGANLLQSHAWGELKGRYGWRPIRLALMANGESATATTTAATPAAVAAAQMLVRTLPGGLLSMAYVPHGPLVAPDDASQFAPRFTTLLAALAERARAERAVFLRLEPPWLDGPGAMQTLLDNKLILTPQTIQPQRTILVDLSPGENAILEAMNTKTRYNIRLAGRKEVEVWEGTAAAIPDWYAIMAETAERNRFGIHSLDYYQDVWDCLAPARAVKLFLAYYQGDLLAGIMVSVFGRVATYLYGASSNQHRERMPNYLLQWEAMRRARSQGCHTYDLWGIPDQDDESLEAQFAQRNDGLWGVYRFKRGFGGHNTRHIGAFDLVLSRPLYRLWNVALTRLQRAGG